jgi:hypothetical protein
MHYALHFQDDARDHVVTVHGTGQHWRGRLEVAGTQAGGWRGRVYPCLNRMMLALWGFCGRQIRATRVGIETWGYGWAFGNPGFLGRRGC